MISQTSLKAYLELQNEGRLDSEERILLDLLEKHPEGLTDNKVSRIFKADYDSSGSSGRFAWPQAIVSARRNGLLKKGKVFFSGRYEVDLFTHKTNKVWVASTHAHLYARLGFRDELIGGLTPLLRLDFYDGPLKLPEGAGTLPGDLYNAPAPNNPLVDKKSARFENDGCQ